jgi:hypothetical protein
VFAHYLRKPGGAKRHYSAVGDLLEPPHAAGLMTVRSYLLIRNAGVECRHYAAAATGVAVPRLPPGGFSKGDSSPK